MANSWDKKNRAEEKKYKGDEKRARRAEKREIIREKKQNQEGVYKKIGPFTIKTYIIMAILIAIGIMMLVDKVKGGNGDVPRNEEVKQESVAK